MIVDKKVFELPSLVTQGGATIRNVRIGWESYGTLAADKSNVVLVTHYFSGTSHAAGRYVATDPIPGYWDAIIGPGKAIDTDRYFVLSSDTLVNINVGAANVVTTGPASIDPATGKPYGMTFPVVTFGDMIAVQAKLLDSLGIGRLRAVVGASGGALQAFEWAVTYPERVERIVPVIGAAGGDASLVSWLDLWGGPIRLDPHWNGGDYYGGTPPLAGVAAALRVVTMQAQGAEWATQVFGRAPADPTKPPEAALANRFKIEAALDAATFAKAAEVDGNTMLYLIRANQLASADPSRIKAPTLMISTPTDLVFPPAWIDRTIAALKAAGTPVEHATLSGPNGHLNGVLHVDQAGPAIAEFLARDLAKR